MATRSRPYWAYTFTSSERLREQERRDRRHGVAGDDEQGGDPCSRGVHCAGRRIVAEGGERKIVPAPTYGPFCPSCTTLIASCLAELPAAWERLAAETGEMHRRGTAGHAPPGPRLPFDASYDELMRRIAEALSSWEERTRTVARLSALDTQQSRRVTGERVRDSARLLGAHLTVLLALEPAPMFRPVPHASSPDDITLLELGGQDAGDEVLALHRRALLVLGEIVRQRETLDGVPCRECEAMALERAEPPSDPAREAMHSHCRECGAQMGRGEFGEWAARYAKWAESSGVTCRRCQAGRCGECQWQRCACAVCGHAAA